MEKERYLLAKFDIIDVDYYRNIFRLEESDTVFLSEEEAVSLKAYIQYLNSQKNNDTEIRLIKLLPLAPLSELLDSAKEYNEKVELEKAKKAEEAKIKRQAAEERKRKKEAANAERRRKEIVAEAKKLGLKISK